MIFNDFGVIHVISQCPWRIPCGCICFPGGSWWCGGGSEVAPGVSMVVPGVSVVVPGGSWWFLVFPCFMMYAATGLV